jgi:DNA-binding response OmpR family regulator
MMTLICRGLGINTDTRRVFVEDRTISLPEKEFILLKSLARRPGNVVLSGILCADIWGDRWPGNCASNRLRRMVDRLRQRIGSKWIESIRGRGYRIAITEEM